MMSVVLQSGTADWQKLQNINQPMQELNGWKVWLELVAKAKAYDELTNQPDCEDENKLPILQKILDRIDELEKKIDAR